MCSLGGGGEPVTGGTGRRTPSAELVLKGEHQEARRSLLVDPPPGLLPAISHVLRCTSCQRLLLSAGERLEADEDKGGPATFSDEFWEDLRTSVLERQQASEEAQKLLEEVLSAPAEERAPLLKGERFQTEEFLARVMYRARREEPETALYLAGLASQLIANRELEEEEAGELLGEAQVIEGNAWRLLGDHSRALDAFRRASGHSSLSPWAASALSRWEGVLWWKLGHFERAEALLRHSLWILREEGPREEEGVAYLLLGLLLLERGRAGRALPLLKEGRAQLDPEERPWLAVQARMALAWRTAGRVAPERTRLLLKQGLKTGESALLSDPRVQWLEGRVMARMGEREQGEQLLETARIRLLAAGQIAPAALATLDLAGHLVSCNRTPEIEGLLNDFRATFPQESAVLDGLERIWAISLDAFQGPRSQEGSQRVEGAFDAFGKRLRRVLRGAGHDVLLPFA